MENFDATSDVTPLRVCRFDIFKGELSSNGKLIRVRSVGHSRLSEGYKTYAVQLKSLVNDLFFLLPERTGQADYAILTREPSANPGRKYFWNKIGEATVLPPPNDKILHLCFDLFGASDIFMSLTPIEREPIELKTSA